MEEGAVEIKELMEENAGRYSVWPQPLNVMITLRLIVITCFEIVKYEHKTQQQSSKECGFV